MFILCNYHYSSLFQNLTVFGSLVEQAVERLRNPQGEMLYVVLKFLYELEHFPKDDGEHELVPVLIHEENTS